MYKGDGRRTQSAWYAPGDRYATCTTDGGSVAARSSRPLVGGARALGTPIGIMVMGELRLRASTRRGARLVNAPAGAAANRRARDVRAMRGIAGWVGRWRSGGNNKNTLAVDAFRLLGFERLRMY